MGLPLSTHRDQAEARLGRLGPSFMAARTALKKAAEEADPEVKYHADALLRQCTALLYPYSSHGATRRAAVARIRAEEAGLDTPTLLALVRSCFDPCELSQVEILDAANPTASQTHLTGAES